MTAPRAMTGMPRLAGGCRLIVAVSCLLLCGGGDDWATVLPCFLGSSSAPSGPSAQQDEGDMVAPEARTTLRRWVTSPSADPTLRRLAARPRRASSTAPLPSARPGGEHANRNGVGTPLL